MFRNLFMILFRPQKTVDRLLEERKFGQSWGATWFLIALNLLAMVLIGLWINAELQELLVLVDPMGGEALMDESAQLVFWGIFAAFSLVTIPLTFILSRFFFKWLVVLGIRMVASREYPTDPAERREKGRLVELIQPYTVWIYMVSMLITIPILPFLFDLSSFVESIEMAEMGGSQEAEASLAMMFIGTFIWSAIAQLVSLGLYIYMIVVRVLALKKIYNISSAKAFFGPFITYMIVYVILFILYFGFMMLMMMLGSSAFDPNMV